jgi:hypothetical protein
MSEEQKHAQHILENWLPFLHRAGFVRNELERLDAGHVFMLACALRDRESEFPLPTPVRLALRNKTAVHEVK